MHVQGFELSAFETPLASKGSLTLSKKQTRVSGIQKCWPPWRQ